VSGRALAAALVARALFALGAQRAPDPAASTALERLAGPLAELVANVQWVRFQRARIAGRAALAVARAEGALAWAPRSTDGWDLLASYLALELASAEREPDVARRRAWLEAGIGVTERGEELADDPARLALLRGVLYTSKAEEDPELDPGGAPALWERAARANERAAALGFAGADAFALAARQRAAD
jgi:hypothetical protein